MRLIGILIAAPGRLKEPWWREAAREYQKRLRPMAQIKIVEIKEEPLPSKPSAKDIGLALDKEAGSLARLITGNETAVPLSAAGRPMTSEALAEFIAEQNLNSREIVFLIGSSHGLSPQILTMGAWNLSFGPMTFPRQMIRVMLLEQIYRAYTILNHMPYHK
ncbi:MAG: 23S rRNA (pseudouridine(1915)-N(3))-methyltransferase RlmH [Peptococcaceae bacterium]|jgi:23S rRNA (pseudouridine1915-N3)-methyltransferase|nr:23S rRNA (pseudouridine(1915)-N(3))-methyltransferase RlmH [Peptococcaceae bacterium]